jgi:hypothetical protein
MLVQKDPCANCGVIINRRTDGFRYNPAKGMLCVDCWEIEHTGEKTPKGLELNQEYGYTPGPWTVDRTDDYGSYQVHEAAREQRDWVDAGYDLSEKEGERRNGVAEQRDDGNRRLIQAAPLMLEELEKIAKGIQYLTTPWVIERLQSILKVIAQAKGEDL